MSGLPHNDDAERSVLGGVLNDNGQLEQAREILSPGTFFSVRHQRIFAALLRLHEAGTALDTVTLKDELVRVDAFRLREDDVDQLTPAYIGGLFEEIPHSSNVPHHARIVREKALKRKLIKQSEKITRAAFNGTTPGKLTDLIEGLVQLDTRAGTGVRATGTELAKAKIVLPRPLVAGLIDEGNRGIIFGDAQAGKSLWALALLAHLAGGFRFAESWDMGRPQKVAMLFFEDRQTSDGGWPPRILWRYQSILAGLRAEYGDTAEAEANILIWCGTDQREAFAAARDHGAKLTAIDSYLNVCTPGADEYRRETIQRDYDRIHTALDNEAFMVIDHTRKGQGEGADGDSDSLFGSVRKKGICDVVIKLVSEIAPNGDQGVVVKPVKGRDGLDLPQGGRFLAWSGMPGGERIPLDEVVQLNLRHVQDRAGTQRLGDVAKQNKELRWAKLKTSLMAAGGSLPISECAELADANKKTIRRWVSEPASPFLFNADKHVEVER